MTPTGGVPFPQQAWEAYLLPCRHEDAKVDVVDLQRSRSRARLARVELGTCGKCFAQLKKQRQNQQIARECLRLDVIQRDVNWRRVFGQPLVPTARDIPQLASVAKVLEHGVHIC